MTNDQMTGPSPDAVDPQWVERIASDQFQALRRREYPYQSGKRQRLTLPRRMVCDLLHFAKKVPSIPMQRRMRLANVVAAREAATTRVGWCPIFTKAYAIVSAARPELRRCYMPFPFGHLYEHPATIASVGIEREYEGEPGVFFGRVPCPEVLRLVEIDALIRYYKTAPLDKVSGYRTMLRVSKLPAPVRRFVWWFGLNARGLYRACFFGTYGISVVASLGAAGLHLLSPLTTTINYGTFEPDGSLDVRVAYDHRVMDGGTVARAMAHLEDVLNGEIVRELRQGHS